MFIKRNVPKQGLFYAFHYIPYLRKYQVKITQIKKFELPERGEKRTGSMSRPFCKERTIIPPREPERCAARRVAASSIPLATALRRLLADSAAAPFPTKSADAGLWRGPRSWTALLQAKEKGPAQ